MSAKSKVVEFYPERNIRPETIYDKVDAAREKREAALRERDAASTLVPLTDITTRIKQTDGTPDSVASPTASAAVEPEAADVAPIPDGPRKRRGAGLAALGAAGLLLAGVAAALQAPDRVSSGGGTAPAEVATPTITAAVEEDASDAWSGGRSVMPGVDAFPETRMPSAVAGLGDKVRDPGIDASPPPRPTPTDIAARSTAPEGEMVSFLSAAYSPVSQGAPAPLGAPALRDDLPEVTGEAPDPLVLPPAGTSDPLALAIADAMRSSDAVAPEKMASDFRSGLFDRIEVVLHAPTGVSDGSTTALLGTIEDMGVPGVELRMTGYRISEDNVRYFHATDAKAARQIAEELGARLKDFTGFSPKPRDGLVEVWMSGEPIVAAPPPVAVATPRRVFKDNVRATGSMTNTRTGGRVGSSDPFTRLVDRVQDFAPTATGTSGRGAKARVGKGDQSDRGNRGGNGNGRGGGNGNGNGRGGGNGGGNGKGKK